MRGTWQTTDSGAGVLLAAGAGILALGAGAYLIAEAVAMLVWVLAAAMVLAAAVIVALAVRANRRVPAAEIPPYKVAAQVIDGEPARSVPPRSAAALPPAEQHVHFHFHGPVTAADVAALTQPNRED